MELKFNACIEYEIRTQTRHQIKHQSSKWTLQFQDCDFSETNRILLDKSGNEYPAAKIEILECILIQFCLLKKRQI